ncbi:MAG: matrixin family metalloprotease [Candidatus Bathyarchaeota archaeon]|nr:matrixin family metalloprotease [Candidatus Bathyarchaeota archaeon]
MADTPLAQVEVQAQNEGESYSLILQGFAWNHTTLELLIVTPSDASWWNNEFLNASLRAIGQWNEAVVNFSAAYPEFAYLSSVEIVTTVSDKMDSGYDIYMNWTATPLSSTNNEVGLSKIFAYQNSAIVNCTMSLATQTNYGQALSIVDMQNVALHELGHAFGLGHCNYTQDLMYPVYYLASGPKDVSSLDAYGVAFLFGWLISPSGFYPTKAWLNQSSVLSPAEVTYTQIPVSPDNAAPQTLATNPIVMQLLLLAAILLRPEILITIVAILVFFIALGIVVRRTRYRSKADS